MRRYRSPLESPNTAWINITFLSLCWHRFQYKYSNLSLCPGPRSNSLWQTCNWKAISLKTAVPWNVRPAFGKQGASNLTVTFYLSFQRPYLAILFLLPFSFIPLLQQWTPGRKRVKKKNTTKKKKPQLSKHLIFTWRHVPHPAKLVIPTQV